MEFGRGLARMRKVLSPTHLLLTPRGIPIFAARISKDFNPYLGAYSLSSVKKGSAFIEKPQGWNNN